MTVRRFELQNSRGESFNLMRKDAFFSSPDGIGVKYRNTFSRVGTSYIPTKKEITQPEIEGVMIFKGYSQYTEFKNHISKQPLKLLYTVNGTTYTIDCLVGEISKSEINNKSNRLESALVLECTSQWYVKRDPIFTAKIDQVGGKVYDYTYDYTYQESLMNQIRATNYSNLESPAIITLYGPIVDPVWRVLVNGKVFQSGECNVTIATGHKLVINSVDDQLEIAEYTEDGEYYRDIYQYINFGKSNFIYLPPGECVVTFTSSDDANVYASVELMEYYETV